MKTALLSKISHGLKDVEFLSLPLLGKLGTKQRFQKVSSLEIVQSTEVTRNWHICMKDRISKHVSV
jgi:hypothetical protein